MTEMDSLRTRIEALKTIHRSEEEKEKQDLENEMREREQLRNRFNALADPVFTTIIEPRLRLLADQFDEAEYRLPGAKHHGIVVFNKNKRLSAVVELAFLITFDDRGTVHLEYCPRILPILLEFKRRETLELPLDQLDEGLIVKFVEDRIVEFVETYLRLLKDPHYQRENLVTDPVCKMTFNRFIAAAQETYGSQTYYFCVAECHRNFLAEPQKYTKPA